MTISIIAAMSENSVIGRAGDLPWRLPDDLKRFKTLTTGHCIIMGRKTFQSVGKPLPNRTSIVITRNHDFQVEGAIVVHNLAGALKKAMEDNEPFICGGGEIYRLALDCADRLYLTVVHAEPKGDTYFPEVDFSQWSLVEDDPHDADNRHAHAFRRRA